MHNSDNQLGIYIYYYRSFMPVTIKYLFMLHSLVITLSNNLKPSLYKLILNENNIHIQQQGWCR